MTNPTITVGMRLAIARRTAKLSAKHMATKLGVTETTISRYENDRTPITAAVLYVYQRECDTPDGWLEGKAELMQEVAMGRCFEERPLREPYAA